MILLKAKKKKTTTKIFSNSFISVFARLGAHFVTDLLESEIIAPNLITDLPEKLLLSGIYLPGKLNLFFHHHCCFSFQFGLITEDSKVRNSPKDRQTERQTKNIIFSE